MKNLKFPDLTTAMDALEQATAHAHAVHTAATDFVNAVKNHKKKDAVLNGIELGEEIFSTYNNLAALTHPNHN